ncbi:putative phopholipase D-family protein [Halobacteriovorax marinus SJ]|uniref:Phopholipase D-family protein n=1 Tax=Halobacteriovorax marinus (strain ATCC BAA-682 / DSM 15412 / SJ) TaxID=862908 RepID=E1WXP1_HALMS|nr:phospholipase D family protein [Halobacteriovorax marinus]CBW25847.1 putative phopholipase D-family protein [Halobacteriovorax marinus SJ]
MKFSTIALTLVLSMSGIKASPLVAPFYVEQDSAKENIQNEMTVLNSGIASLQFRLDMIKRAKKSIEVEYFIYNQDQAGRILTQALVEAAKRGVKVRILVDKSMPIFAMDNHIAKELRQYGVDLRFYNDATLLELSTTQFRSHRKLFLIDDVEAITGGRNIGDDYFDLSDHFNFLDRDIHVKGSIVKTMRESFDKYFEHKIVEDPKEPIKPTGSKISLYRGGRRATAIRKYESDLKQFKKAQANAKHFLLENDTDREIKEKVEIISRPILQEKKSYNCPLTTYATDLPGARFSQRLRIDYGDTYRVLRKVMGKKIDDIKTDLLISSPYFINNKITRGMMYDLLDKNINIKIYTNSLGSTDAVYVAANFYADVFKWQAEGVNPYIHNGKWIPEHPTISEGVKTAKWGTHSKTQIYDNDEVMIGTYNVDNRSNYYNSEMAIFCKGNPELTKEVADNIHSRTKAGYRIIDNHEAVDENNLPADVYGNPTKMSKFIMNAIAIPSILLRDLL